jgi:hypothetical protein
MLFNALLDKRLDVRKGHLLIARRLGARTVAVEAFQVALVSDVDFCKLAAWVKLPTHMVGDEGLGTNKLNRIQDQSFGRNVAMAGWCLHSLGSSILQISRSHRFCRPAWWAAPSNRIGLGAPLIL